MAEYIERGALLEKAVNGIVAAIDVLYAPAADVVEVVHGRWIPAPEYDSCWCSCCKKQYTGFFASGWNFCPNCGARMDGE